MADLTFVANQAGQDTSLTSTTISASVPSGTVSGNGQRIWYSSAVLTGGGAPTHTAPAGWTAAGTTTYTGLGGLDGRVTCYVKIAGSSESAVTLTSSANAAHQYHYSTYSNPDAAAFLNASAVFTTVTSGTSHAIPSITTTTARVLLDQVLFATSASITWTPPGGTTERVDANSTALGDEIQAVAGASGTRTWTSSASTASVIGQVALAGNVVTITAQPTDQTVNNGATATFSVTASGGVAPLSYQWQDNSSGSFANISGATSSSYAPTAAYSMQGRQYRCIVTDATAQATTSNSATLRVAFNLTGTGPRAYPNLGHPWGAGSFESWLRGTNAGGGPTTESRTLTSAGIGAASFQPALTNAQTVTSAGVGAFSPAARAIIPQTVSSAGVGAANFASAAVYAQTMTSAGVATPSFSAASVLPVTVVSAGVGAANFTAQALNAQSVSSAGAATVTLVSVGINAVTFTSAGAATVTISGTDANGGATIESRTVTAAGVAAASFQALTIDVRTASAAGVGAFNAQSAATVAAQFASAGIGALIVQAGQIELRTLTSAGVAAASFSGSDANTPTIEARTVTAAGSAAVQFIASDANAIVIPGVGFQDFAAAGGLAKPAKAKQPRIKTPKRAEREQIQTRIEARGLNVEIHASARFIGLEVPPVLVRGLFRTKPTQPYPKLMRDSCPHCGAPAAHVHQ